jgi:hypothetical protein
MQVVEVDDVIVQVLGAHQQVADDAGVFGYFNPNGIIDCPHRGQSMGVRSDAAGALHKMVSIPGVSTLQDKFNTAEHLT